MSIPPRGVGDCQKELAESRRNHHLSKKKKNGGGLNYIYCRGRSAQTICAKSQQRGWGEDQEGCWGGKGQCWEILLEEDGPRIFPETAPFQAKGRRGLVSVKRKSNIAGEKMAAASQKGLSGREIKGDHRSREAGMVHRPGRGKTTTGTSGKGGFRCKSCEERKSVVSKGSKKYSTCVL